MHIALQDAIARQLQDSAQGQLFSQLFAHGSLTVEIYAPQEKDNQQPHTQDELYVIISGSGTFVHAAQERSFRPGDLIFVPAGDVHYFKNFSDNFRTWVIFYGPAGGEKNCQEPVPEN